MTGERPVHPVAPAELARVVFARCEPRARDYVFGGAGAEDTMRVNEEAFRRWRIVPRTLRDVSERDLRVTVLDTDMPAPVALAPIASQWKPRDLQHAYQPVLQGIGMANYTSDPVFRAMLPASPEDDPQAAVGAFVGQFPNPRLSWADLEFLRSRTTLPIVLKGLLHPDDARMAREHGVDAVVVSNHGGRQVDGAIASLDALPAIVDVLGGELQVLLDSGIRGGADVVKALSLGADAVLLGRPYLWGLAAGGEAGVLAVIRGLLAELDVTLGLSGHTAPGQLDAGVLVRASI